MKLETDTVVEGRQRDGAAWGVSETPGNVVLVVIAGSRRALVEMTYEQALETGIGAIYVGQGVRMMVHEAAGAQRPQSALVDPMGVPLGGR